MPAAPAYRTFVVGGPRQVPAALWVPQTPGGPRPLVLIGHGGSGNKRTVAAWAERFAVERGYVVAAVDGPVHGDRRTDGAPPDVVLAEFRALWTDGDPKIDEMVADWHATLDYLVTLQEVDSTRVAWCGVSAGTAYGLPFVASEPRVRAALFGMWGLSYPSSERLADDAPLVHCPVLFQRKAEDALFTVEGQEQLFDLLGSADKQLVVYPGGHAVDGPTQVSDMVDFVSRNLEPERLGV